MKSMFMKLLKKQSGMNTKHFSEEHVLSGSTNRTLNFLLMKYIQKIGLLVLLAFFFACDTLDVEPLDKIPAEDAIKDEKGLAAAINGVYDQLQSVGFAEDALTFADLAADNLIHRGSKKEYRQISDNRLTPDNIYIAGIWNSCYDGINRVNNIIVALDDVEGVSEAAFNKYAGQAYFLRALNYFTLVKYFGGVPLKQTPTEGASPEDLNILRASVQQVYQFIISDLQTAETLLDEYTPATSAYAGKYAVKALLARTYLYYSQYEDRYSDAADKALEVIESGEYSLASDSAAYAAIFDEENASGEIIFHIDFTNDDDNNALADWFNINGRFEVAAWDTYDRITSIADAYEEEDNRKFVTIQSGVYEGRDEYYCVKYDDTKTRNDNVIILRLAEMYLIRAEALNKMSYVANGEAFDLLNAVRERVNATPFSAGDLPGGTPFGLAIQEERRLELAFEGHRLFDLRRSGIINDVLPDIGNMATNGWIFPIPQSEIDTNPAMTQNGNY